MAAQPIPPIERRRHDPEQHERLKNGAPKPAPHGVFRSIGLGLITGAADDDPSAIGTYAAAGAAMSLAGYWTAVLPWADGCRDLAFMAPASPDPRRTRKRRSSLPGRSKVPYFGPA